MPEQNIHHLETPESLYINRFWTGLYKNRSPLFTPISALGIQLIERQDVILNGHDMMLTPQFSCKRRYGFSKACTSQFGVSEWPLAFFSFVNLSGTVTPMVDTTTTVYWFTGVSNNMLHVKTGGAGQSSFCAVGNTVYWVDGQTALKWSGASVSLMGIATPAITPTLSFGAGSLSPKIGYSYVYCFFNSTTGQPSSASPFSANTGPQTSQNITVQGNGSSDPQVSNIQIYRTADGGALYYLLATISNPGVGTWSYTDSTPDSGLNTAIVAPVAGVNNPPPTGATLLCWYGGRLWAASGNTLYFSAGPDATNGVGPECWPAANNYTLPGPIKSLLPTNQGLVIFTIDNAYVTTGSTASTFTVPQIWQQNLGVPSQNAVTQDGDNFYFFTSRGKVYNCSNASLSEIGQVNALDFANMTAANIYIAVHRSGVDEGIFISDGSSKIYRFSQVSQAWDTPMQVVGGCDAIGSIELSAGVWALTMGRPTGSGYSMKRDLTTYQDDGTSFTTSVTFGSLIVAPPRKIATISSVLLQATNVGTYPTVSIMANEVADNSVFPATFTAIPNPVPDPPMLAGYQNTIWMKRHDFLAAQTPLPKQVQHMQIKIDFIAENQPSEILGFGVA